MNSLQDYIDRYDKIIKNLGYSGESVEVLKQLMANNTYINEVEQASYMIEASLEKATLINSKIQHCMDKMYSVYRGSCPRVVAKIRPTKYLNLNPFDVLVESQNFKVHYLGYYQLKDKLGRVIGDYSKEIETVLATESDNIIDTSDGTGITETEDSDNSGGIEYLLSLLDNEGNPLYTGSWVESSALFSPSASETGAQLIKAFIAPKRTGDNLTIEEQVSNTNTYYVDCPLDNLSDDVYVELEGEMISRTRLFSEHILNHSVFDLTLPNFGSRIYLANYYKDTVGRSSTDIEGITKNVNLKVNYFGYSELDSYNETELYRIKIQGAEILSFVDNSAFLTLEQLTESTKGLCFINEVPHDSLNTIHYKANRDRFVNSILRSNSDIGTVLEETYPSVVKSEGTSYYFESPLKSSSVILYYIPKNDNIILSSEQIEDFITKKRAYYVITSNISVKPGTKYIASFNINADLFKNSGSDTDFSESIGQNILVDGYEKKFGVSFSDSELKSIESLISKLSNVKKVTGISVTYTDISGNAIDFSEIDSNSSYFEIKYSITTSVSV